MKSSQDRWWEWVQRERGRETGTESQCHYQRVRTASSALLGSRDLVSGDYAERKGGNTSPDLDVHMVWFPGEQTSRLRVVSGGAIGNTRSGGVEKKFRKARLDRGKIEPKGSYQESSC